MLTQKQIKSNLRDICEKYEDIFDRVILFGSYSRDEQTEGSDIDLYIESSMTTGKALTSRKFRNFECEVYDAFDNMQEFDFLVFGGKRDIDRVKKSPLYVQIEKDGVLIYDKRAKAI